MTETRRRVKVYNLNDERQWDDRGTGHVSSAYVERLKGMTLIVRSERDGSLLLESRILPNTAYQKQQETLIVWSEGENTDLALSFQEKTGCDEIWEKICEVQGKDPSVEITQDIVDDEEDDLTGRLDESAESLQRHISPCTLPPCELGELEEIAEMFSTSLPSPVRREQVARAIEGSDYITKLLTLFRTCEDLEDTESLHKLFEIMKCLFLFNRSGLFDIMLQEGHIMDVVGCLEFDPSLSKPQKHRDYLLHEVNFKEVLPIKNPELLKKIHQTFRLQYIQDVVLPTPSVFEENLLSTLSSIIFFNKVEIVNLIRDDENFLSSIFKQIQDEEIPDSRKIDLAGFIRELFALSQTLQPVARDEFFRQLGALGILPVVELLLGSDESQLQRLGVDIFAHVVEHSPSMVRDFARKEAAADEAEGDDDVLLLNLVIEQMIYDPDPELGRATQVTSLLRLIVDPESMIASKNEKTEFLAFFYRNCMHVMMAPLLANTAGESPGKDDYSTAHMLSLILELLTFSVEHHTFNIKNYILNKDLLRRVLVLLRSRHMFLSLAALRFMRKIISMLDEFYNRYIVKGNLFAPVVDALFKSGSRYNLLNSTILEMFEFIRMENVKSLIACIVENHYDRLQEISYTKIFSGIKLRYDQEKSRGTRSGMASGEYNHRFRRDAREPEEEEELWFDKEDDVDFADSFDTPRINIDSVLGDSRTDPLKKSFNDKPMEAVVNSNGTHEGTVESNEPDNNPAKDADNPPANEEAAAEVRNGLVGLVDYPDDDSEEDDSSTGDPTPDKSAEGGEPAVKKPRLKPGTDD